MMIPSSISNVSKSKKDTDGHTKPKQPLSAYNLFFKVERKRILDETDHLGLRVSRQELQDIISKRKTKAKRVHRKSHGKIGFRDLARTIAQRWKSLDLEERQVYDEQAAIEKEEYVQSLAVWKEAMKAQEEKVAKTAGEGNVISSSGSPGLTGWSNNNNNSKPMVEMATALRNHESVYLEQVRQLRSQINAEIERIGMMAAKTTVSTRDAAAFILAAMYPVSPAFGIIQNDIQVLRQDEYVDEQRQQKEQQLPGSLSILAPSSSSQVPRQQEQQLPCFPSASYATATYAQAVREYQQLSPIFREASLAGYDLFEAINPRDMDQVFMD